MREARPSRTAAGTRYPRCIAYAAALGVGAFLVAARVASATDFTGTNFKVRDPVLSGGGGYAASSNFRLWSAVAQPAVGTSASSNFGVRAGFLYFPAPASSPSPASSPTPTPPGAPGNSPEETQRSVREFLARLISFPPFPGLPIPPELFAPCPIPRRSDLNCDGRVDLRDFSIFISKPARVSPFSLSVVLADWTGILPALLRLESNLAYEALKSEPPSKREGSEAGREGLANVGEVFGPGASSGIRAGASSETSIRRKGFFAFLGDAIRLIGHVFVRLFRFLKGLVW